MTHARASVAARELGVEGATNEEAVRDADLVVLATNADAPSGPLESSARRHRLEAASSRVASELSFSPSGVLPSPTRPRRLAERLQTELDGPVLAGLHSLAASTLGSDEPPDEDAFVCGDDADAKSLVLEVAERLTAGQGASMPARLRARAPSKA